ncbi:MAG: hypothetical protein K2X03_16230 [Bryobacteraceae bacterium]|nr:hypothetical protein [Bryobacteraceae bacterium]
MIGILAKHLHHSAGTKVKAITPLLRDLGTLHFGGKPIADFAEVPVDLLTIFTFTQQFIELFWRKSTPIPRPRHSC